MQIDSRLIQHLANLSRLHFSEEAMITMQADLEKMIGFVNKLNELDTTGVPPLMHMTEGTDIYRTDLSGPPLDNADAIKNAGKSAQPYFLVPKVIS